MNMIGQTYFDRVGNKQLSGDAALKRKFDQAINAAVEEVIEQLPELLAPLLDEKGAELFGQMPDCLACPDPVTRQVITEAVVRRMLAGKVGNKLGRGMNFLQVK